MYIIYTVQTIYFPRNEMWQVWLVLLGDWKVGAEIFLLQRTHYHAAN